MLKAHAQLGFCTGNSGDPIFTETFRTGTTNSALPTGTTTYTYTSGYPNDSFYTVSNGTIGNGFDWHQTQDHTPNDTNGKCLIVNAAASAGQFYKTSITGLCETTTYEFSAWLINLVRAGSFCSGQPGGTIPVNVRFEIWDSTDTILIKGGNTGAIIESTNPIWTEYGLVFQTSVGQNSVILKMINNGQGGCGNDLAIDDIEFKSCGDLVTVTDSNNNNNAASLCSSQLPFTETLTATPDFAVYNSHFYQWQRSIDSGITWMDLTGEINQTLSISPIVTTSFRSKIAEFATNLNNAQCVSFSSEYRVVINQAPPMPAVQCWETPTLNTTTCLWEVSGAQPIQPAISCWETATFNNTTCLWEVSGTQPIQPIVSCWETATFNNSTCLWEVSGTQPIQPIVSCWETATFNNSTCLWEVSGTQPIQPAVSCWETATFNNTTCSWDVSGTQPVQPITSCWEVVSFNNTTCLWEVMGTQPVQPIVSCWEAANFNTATCSWVISGTKPVAPTGLNCWETTTFNTTTCVWDILGTPPGEVFTEDLVYCNGDTPTLYANTNLLNPTYLWSTGATTESIIVNTPNVYSVEITSASCFFETKIFHVTQAATSSIDTISSDGSNIVITTSNTGDFLYSLDGNTYQSANTFFNVKGGLYTIYVKAQNCPEIQIIPHLHFYIPKYFTPNNDGVNDVFSLNGIEFYAQSEVSIFNRYGKLIKYSQNGPFSWDGTLNNVQLPTDDYWYNIIILDQKFTGHFSLKR